jgi:hypothetical protein
VPSPNLYSQTSIGAGEVPPIAYQGIKSSVNDDLKEWNIGPTMSYPCRRTGLSGGAHLQLCVLCFYPSGFSVGHPDRLIQISLRATMDMMLEDNKIVKYIYDNDCNCSNSRALAQTACKAQISLVDRKCFKLLRT